MRPRQFAAAVAIGCALWAAILVPLILWGLSATLAGSLLVNGLFMGRALTSALRVPREPKPDYCEISRLEQQLGMGGVDLDRELARAQVTYHGHAGPCTDACPHP